MSTRELAYNIIDNMNDEQIESFVMFFKKMFPYIPNLSTSEAIMESEKMLNDPNSQRFGSIEELFEELESWNTILKDYPIEPIFVGLWDNLLSENIIYIITKISLSYYCFYEKV